MAREMMFGTREEFEYVECGSCGSVQIGTIPTGDAIARHYPPNYYALKDKNRSNNYIKQYLLYNRTQYALGKQNWVGALTARLWPPPLSLELFKRLKIKSTARIVDVGCGTGVLLDELAAAGFCNLLGADPFIGSPMLTPRGVKILNMSIEDVSGQFEIVMFHHSLEHVADPVGALQAACGKLAETGICIVRIPTTSSLAWQRYGKDWVQLDPPRHFLVPSRKGMAIMAARGGLALEQTIDDSFGMQFWGSEQYRRDIPMSSGMAKSLFSKAELAEYDRRSAQANARGVGDQAAFIFRRAEPTTAAGG